MFERFDLKIDVSSAVPEVQDETLETAVSVVAPKTQWPPRTVLFAFPGRGFGRRYFDLDIPGFSSYSQAEFHGSRGWLAVSCDHLCVGDSTVPSDPSLLSLKSLAAANDATVRTVLRMLEEGGLIPNRPPLATRPFVVGAGQSMGGGISIVTQGRHQTFDALAILGHSVLGGVVLPLPNQESNEMGVHNDLESALSGITETQLRHVYYMEDVPSTIVEADLNHVTLQPSTQANGIVPAWASTTEPPPPLSFAMVAAGALSAEAAAISVPVITVAGEREVLRDIRAEAAAYASSPDVTTTIMYGSAHMHNFATTRSWLWQRLHLWAEGAADMSRNK
jgi:hypothetical protein